MQVRKLKLSRDHLWAASLICRNAVTWHSSCPKMSYCSRSCRWRFTVRNFKWWALVAFTAIFSNICTAHAQKRLFMKFRCKVRHRCSIRRPRFPIRLQNFSDMATFSVDFGILYAECPPHFYFRVVWPTDLESIPHVTWPCDLDLWPVDLEHGAPRDQPFYRVWRPYAYLFLSYVL